MNRWISGHVAWPITERLCGRNTASRLRDLRATQNLDATSFRELQTFKLQRLLRHAAAHCPFYAQRLSAAGLGGDLRDVTLAELQRIPMLTRDDIREHRDAMTWTQAPGGCIPCSTGGSSGEPLQLFIDSQRSAADWAARWRAREWWNLRPGDPEVLLWGGPVRHGLKDRLKTCRDRWLNQHVLSAFDLSPVTMTDYVERIRALNPACIYGYASSLALLARFASEEMSASAPLATPRLRAVFTTGEILTPADRDAIARAFKVPVAQEYGCRDGGLLGCACPDGSLHVPQENAIVEIVDESGRPVPPGETGDVVITCLETFAMPIIRYRNGDLAVEGESPCRCGRHAQILKNVCGRRTDHVICRRGKGLVKMHALALIYVIREVEGVRQFRIHQPSLDSLEVDITTGRRFKSPSEQRIISGLLERMGEGVRIDLRYRDHIPPLPSGKHVCVTSDVQESGAARKRPNETADLHPGSLRDEQARTFCHKEAASAG